MLSRLFWAKIEEAVDPAAGILNMLGIGRQLVLVVGDVQLPCREQLPLIVQAIDAGGIALGLGQGRQQQAGEDRDDGDHDQQLDQREALAKHLARRLFRDVETDEVIFAPHIKSFVGEDRRGPAGILQLRHLMPAKLDRFGWIGFEKPQQTAFAKDEQLAFCQHGGA